MIGLSDVQTRLQTAATDAGVTAWVHAFRIGDPGTQVSLHGDVPVAIASLFKLPLALGWASLAHTGQIDPLDRLTLAPEGRAHSGTGVAMLLDEVSLTQRDAVRMMLALSDNACADAILQTVGRERLAGTLAGHGLSEVMVRRSSGESWRAVQHDTGASDPSVAERALASVEADVLTSEYDAALASAATARGLCRILDVLWAQNGSEFDLVRDALGQQPWSHRIRSGLPHDDVSVHGKTGTLGRLRHEAAVVTFPHEVPIAVAVLTRSVRAELYQPRVDAAIGNLARLAVTPLRRAAS